MSAACIDTPISWLRLEQHAIAANPEVAAHLAACGACRACMDEIRGDAPALPALPRTLGAAARRPAPARWKRFAPAFALAAAAAAVLIWLARPDDRADRFAVKGGELVLGLVRERGGAIAEDATTFRPSDRWKVVVSCPPALEVELGVSVYEVGGSGAPDHPLAPAKIACGNRVALPGAFAFTGARPNVVCVTLGPASACRTVTAE